MKKANLKELSRQLLGTVTDHPDVLEHFSTDASIFQVIPDAVVYPQNTADVRKTVQYIAGLAAAGKPASLIARGGGSDYAGAALGEGTQIVFPAHMNKLLRLDRETVAVQPGLRFSTLQQTLHTHNRFLPPAPLDTDHATLGGAVANNCAGPASVKYGPIRNFVKGLKVVLADGSIIKTHRLSARELNRKKGLTSLEGEVYRKVDSILLDHTQLIKKRSLKSLGTSAGYALGDVRHKDGSFDLSQLFIGAQGTLGLITEITLATAPYNPRTTLVVGYARSAEDAGSALSKLRALGPSALEMVDANLLELLREHRPRDLEGIVPDPLPAVVIFAEFDEFSQFGQKFRSVRAQRILARHGSTPRVSTDPVEQVALWKLRYSAAGAGWLSASSRCALPCIDDAVVPPDRLPAFMEKTTKLLKKYELTSPMWGHAGTANLHLQPALDLARKKDVDKLFSLVREFGDLTIGLGGAPTASYNDGLLRAPYLAKLYGEEMMELFAATKHIFDPQRIFNPGKKTEATETYARAHLRSRYSLASFSDHPLNS